MKSEVSHNNGTPFRAPVVSSLVFSYLASQCLEDHTAGGASPPSGRRSCYWFRCDIIRCTAIGPAGSTLSCCRGRSRSSQLASRPRTIPHNLRTTNKKAPQQSHQRCHRCTHAPRTPGRRLPLAPKPPPPTTLCVSTARLVFRTPARMSAAPSSAVTTPAVGRGAARFRGLTPASAAPPRLWRPD